MNRPREILRQAISGDEQPTRRRRFRYWPGMPTPGSEFMNVVLLMTVPLLALLIVLPMAIRGCISDNLSP